MNLTILSYNGSTLTSYIPHLRGENIGLDANILSVERVNDTVSYAGKSFKPSQFELIFAVNPSGSQRQTDLETLSKIFNPRDPTLYNLVATDGNDSNKQYYIACTPERNLTVQGQAAMVQMWTADPVWKTVNTLSGTINVVAGGGTVTCTTSGNVDTYPTVTVTALSGIGLYRYRRHSVIYNTLNDALNSYPIDITGGGWDTATLVSGGFVQSDGDDIRVLDGGVEIERWLGGMNTAATRVWVVLNFESKGEGLLATALSASGNTSITFKDTSTSRKLLDRLPDKGLVKIDSEVIAYSAKSVISRQLTISNSGRGYKNTTAASHSVGATIRWIQHDLVIQYGNASVTAPTQTDLQQPCFSLANSTNTNWRWDSADSVFCDLAGLRSGGWSPTTVRGEYSYWYSGNEGTVEVDPATSMGAYITSYQSGAVYKAEQAQIWWTLVNPCTFGTISSLGEKYRYASTNPWPRFKLLSSATGVAGWNTEWTEAAPGTAGVWTSWTHANEALPNNISYLRFEFVGAMNSAGSACASVEVDLGASGSMGVTMPSATVPQVTFNAQENAIYTNFTVTNAATGDALTYGFPLVANDVLTLDTENRTVTYKDAVLGPPDFNSVRQEWLRMKSGANAISYADANGGTATVVVSWPDRKNI